MMDDSARMSLRNQQTVELARRHCLNWDVDTSGGGAMAESATGLPIDMGQVRCPLPHEAMGSTLGWITAESSRENCVGCAQCRATGDVPNLAAVIEDAHAGAKALLGHGSRRRGH
jgi:hypothetical protein